MPKELKEEYQIVGGKYVLVSSEEVELPSTEEIIADKEAQMLKMYNEIQQLKDTEDA